MELSKGINVFVGRNGAGKSTVLKSAYLLQGSEQESNFPNVFMQGSIRVGEPKGEVRILLSDPNKKQLRCLKPEFDIQGWSPEFFFSATRDRLTITMRKNNPATDTMAVNLPICAQREPDNFIYPYFSRRKPSKYQLVINRQSETIVEEVPAHLPAKIDRLLYPQHSGFRDFQQICSDCLGFQIVTATHNEGKEAGIMVSDQTILPIDKMGEGTPALLALITHLCVAKGKLFVIEELENDLHPAALKALLEFIIIKSAENQFIVSTHSNIVLRVLGGAPGSRIFAFKMHADSDTLIPTSTSTLLDDNPESRIRLLQDLGYDPSDLYLYDAYLILEESSAERLIRDFIVPHMFPRLQGRLKTISASGVSKIVPAFSDYHRLFVYLHTSPQYHDKAWAVVDAGPEGEKAMAELKNKFKDWDPSRFRCLAQSQFEAYYPTPFKEEVEQTLALPKGPEKNQQKGKLAEAVTVWSLQHAEDAKQWFTNNAADLLTILQQIQRTLNPNPQPSTLNSQPSDIPG